MILQDFAEITFPPAPTRLLVVEVREGKRWVTLPERHHTTSLAVNVMHKEMASRNCLARVSYADDVDHISVDFLRCPECGDCPRERGISEEEELDFFDVVGADDNCLFCQQCDCHFSQETGKRVRWEA
jgi:hypothetical protein